MKYYAAINDEYLGKSIKDGSLAIFEEKKDAERVCSKMDYDLIEVSVVKHETYSRLTEENAKLREVLESIQRMQSRTPELPDDYSHEDVGLLNDRIDEIFGKVNTALNQLKDQNNDK